MNIGLATGANTITFTIVDLYGFAYSETKVITSTTSGIVESTLPTPLPGSDIVIP